jgi:hypothetical protein
MAPGRANEIHDANNAAATVKEQIARPASCSRRRYVFHLMYDVLPVEFWCRPQPVSGNAVNCQSVVPYKPFFVALSNSHIERRILDSDFQSCNYILSKLKEARRQDEVVVGQRYISAGEVAARIFQFSM